MLVSGNRMYTVCMAVANHPLMEGRVVWLSYADSVGVFLLIIVELIVIVDFIFL